MPHYAMAAVWQSRFIAVCGLSLNFAASSRFFFCLATMRELIAHCGCRAALIPVPDALIQSFNLLTLQGPFGKTVR